MSMWTPILATPQGSGKIREYLPRDFVSSIPCLLNDCGNAPHVGFLAPKANGKSEPKT